MLDLNIEKIVVLVLAALFILGPERLPGAVAWLGRTLRQVKAYASGASEQLRNELGPEFDELRKPLQDLHGSLHNLRAVRDPRTALLRGVFTETTPPATRQPATRPPVTRPATHPAGSPVQEPTARRAHRPLEPGERPPTDDDAT